MVNVNLTDDDKLRVIEETKELVDEYNRLSMDILILKEQKSNINIIKRATSPEYNSIYELMDKKITLKSRRLVVISKKIEENKEKLGISEIKLKKKKKNK